MPTTRIVGIVALLLALGACSTGSPSSAGRSTTLVPNASLPLHCGVRFMSFDGVAWEADPPVPQIDDVVTEPGGGGHSRFSVSGQMVRLSETSAVFTTTEEPVGVTVRFHRWDGTIPGCA